MTFKTKMYYSGSMKNELLDRKFLEEDCLRLFTFAYPKEAIEFLQFADSIGKRAHLMIDSGAFTAWNSGKPVTLDELLYYDQYLVKNFGDRHDFVFISLDVIPGDRGRAPTPEEMQAGMDVSYTNYQSMQEAIPFPVLPVYHSGEPIELRDAYLRLTDYICLSMNQTLSEKNRVQWARNAFKLGAKMHGLAATGNKMLTQVDWYSVDSSGWLMVAGMGSILMPHDGGVRVLAISKESPSRQTPNGHYTTLLNQSPIDKAVADRGFNIEKLQTDYITRMLWNIEMWIEHPWVKDPVPGHGLFEL